MRSAVLSCKILMVALVMQLGILVAYPPAKTSAMAPSGVVSIVNEYRSQNGLAPLSEHGALASSATMKANDMFAKNYWAHYSPDGLGPGYFIGAAGYSYLSAGENLAKGFSYERSVVNAWMGSAGHRANLLNPNFQDIGVAVVPGVINGAQTTVVVGHFGQSSYVAPPAPAPAPAPAPTPAPQPVPEPVPAPRAISTNPTSSAPSPVTEATVASTPETQPAADNAEPPAPQEPVAKNDSGPKTSNNLESDKKKLPLHYRQFLTSVPKFDLKIVLSAAKLAQS